MVNTHSFRVPLGIHPDRREKIKRLSLLFSRDKGESWTLIKTRFPERATDGFKFTGGGPIIRTRAMKPANESRQ
jgi:hypothetical protein